MQPQTRPADKLRAWRAA